MNDYHLELKIRNGILKSLMDKHGIQSGSELARKIGASPSDVSRVLTLREPAYTTKGSLHKTAQRLCEFFGVLPDEIYPEGHLIEPMAQNTFEAFVEADQLTQIAHIARQSDPEEALKLLDSGEAFENVMKLVSEREAKMLHMRFIRDLTYKQCGDKLGVTLQRARQIEERALRKLRKPERRDKLLTALRAYDFLENIENHPFKLTQTQSHEQPTAKHR